MRTSALTAAMLALAFAGCATTSEKKLSYAEDAEANLERGRSSLESNDFEEASRYFEYVRRTYPFLDAGREAELWLADTDFKREQWTAARERYETFAKVNPTHPRAEYATYRAALTHYKDIPSDLFILPPSYEKDQTEVHAAVSALTGFLRRHPDSELAAEARTNLEDARRRLARHELYVAGFYAKRNRWAGAVNRLRRVLDLYPGLGLEPAALLELHQAYLKLGDEAKAQDALKRLREGFPESPEAEKAARTGES